VKAAQPILRVPDVVGEVASRGTAGRPAIAHDAAVARQHHMDGIQRPGSEFRPSANQVLLGQRIRSMKGCCWHTGNQAYRADSRCEDERAEAAITQRAAKTQK
jgi:hypothetical protein